jgi:hypothetical protein
MKNDKVLRGVRPNAGIEAAYRKKLVALITEMDNSVQYWLRAAYRANEPVMAQDRIARRRTNCATRSKNWRGAGRRILTTLRRCWRSISASPSPSGQAAR